MSANPQPLALGLIFLLAFAYFGGLWKLSPARRTWFAKLMAVTSPMVGGLFVFLSFLGLPTWHAQVLIYLATELPVALILSAVCLAQAGRRPKRRTVAFGAAANRRRLRSALDAAPAVLFGSWFLAGLAGMARPVPALEALSSATLDFLLFKWAVVVPQAFYSGLVSWLFLAAALRAAPTVKLRLKNYAFSVGTFAWLLLSLNSMAHALVRVTLPDGTREAVATANLLIEPWLLLSSLVAIGLGLGFRYVPVVNEVLVQRAYPRLLRLQDRVESLRWHLVRGSKARELTRVLYYARQAAARLELPEADTERSLTALQLTAIMSTRSTDAEQALSDMAAELHPLQKEVMRDPELASRIKWPKGHPTSHVADEPETLVSDPLHDALGAALHLTGTVPTAESNGVEHTLWYQLAAVAAADAGMISTERANPSIHRLAQVKASTAYKAVKHERKAPVARETNS